ncbi:ABC-F family ATP-binding cassette domain-containing protein [Saccharopolyspora sp. 5N708]|uniref:ABC-F family ATP-binding cassette domain-containing protein n=1 Tax=Saccharopolyspora sp. 5N708 TaxID=3457424 RepID=UPI003FD372D9
MIICTDLSFSWPDGTVLFDDITCSIGPGRTGLVAPNGTGKSTLLKLIAGEVPPTRGTVTVDGLLGYLPQTLPLDPSTEVADVLGIAPVVRALHAIESGDADEAHFAVIGADWDVEERATAEMHRLGLGDVALDRRLGTLSGGQAVALGLAAQLLKRPEALLLDEPTNNLDREARYRLYDVLDEWKGSLLLVSHDRVLLDRVDQVAELRRNGVSFHGGNFTDYQAAVQAEREVAERNVRTAEQEVKREKRELQLARERAARRAGNAARNTKSAGNARIAAGNLKRWAQASAGKTVTKHNDRVDDAKSRLDEAERALRDEQRITLSLPATNVPAGRTVFTGTGMRVCFRGRPVFVGGGVDLMVRGPERIALTGSNGAGKSTLLRAMAGEVALDGGEIVRADGRVAYLSQRLDLLDLDRSVRDNLRQWAPSMPESDAMNLLARFLFKGQRVHIPVSALSGGERMRATLACVLSSEPAPQLLLLDEPTNNLDLQGLQWLENALNAYEGAFVVVSHDDRFLEGIRVDRWLRLADGVLSEERGLTGV